MASDLYGAFETMRRARGWMPHLETPGQRAVYGAMLMFCSLDGRMSPSGPQIAHLTGLKETTVRNKLMELRNLGALVPVGHRPVLDADGIAKGGRIVRYSIPLSPDGDTGEFPLSLDPVPLSPKRGPTVTPESDTLNNELLKRSKEHQTDPSPDRLNPDKCPHIAITDEGDCAACGLEAIHRGAHRGGDRPLIEEPVVR